MQPVPIQQFLESTAEAGFQETFVMAALLMVKVLYIQRGKESQKVSSQNSHAEQLKNITKSVSKELRVILRPLQIVINAHTKAETWWEIVAAEEENTAKEEGVNEAVDTDVGISDAQDTSDEVVNTQRSEVLQEV